MSKNILIIEDSPFQAKVLEAALSESGFQTSVANDGQTALKMLTDDVDAIVLDTVLPDTDGFELCKKIRQQVTRDLTIIMTTGTIDAVDAIKARQCGADDYAVKTEDLEHLIEVVEECIASKC